MVGRFTPQKTSVWPVVIIFLIVGYVLYATLTFLYKNQSLRREISTIQSQNDIIRANIQQQRAELKYLATPQRIDKEAKIQLDKRQPGEKVIVIVDPPQYLTTAPPQKSPEERYQQLPNWKRWLWVFWPEEKR